MRFAPSPLLKKFEDDILIVRCSAAHERSTPPQRALAPSLVGEGVLQETGGSQALVDATKEHAGERG